MPSLSDLLGNPLSDIMHQASDIIARFVPDPQAKVNAQLELAKLQGDAMAQVLKAESDFAAQQAITVTGEEKSESWLARNWRPITMMVFVYIIAHNFVIAQLFSLKMLPIPPDMWELIKLGLGGYIFGRSAEKILPKMTDSITGAVATIKTNQGNQGN